MKVDVFRPEFEIETSCKFLVYPVLLFLSLKHFVKPIVFGKEIIGLLIMIPKFKLIKEKRK